MISKNIIDNLIKRERRFWERRTPSQFINGVIMGLTISQELLTRVPAYNYFDIMKRHRPWSKKRALDSQQL